MSDKDNGWLIFKSGVWYRPNASGYTNDPSAAGRYSYEDAMKHSHPNGPDGPRDGMSIKHESEVAGAISPDADLLRQAIEALTNSCDLLENYIDTFGDMSGANRADLNDYRAVLTAYDKREQS